MSNALSPRWVNELLKFSCPPPATDGARLLSRKPDAFPDDLMRTGDIRPVKLNSRSTDRKALVLPPPTVVAVIFRSSVIPPAVPKEKFARSR